MKKSTRILQELDASDTPMTNAELAAAIDEPDEAKSVGVMMCYLRNAGRVEQGEKREGVTWIITDAGREFLTDVLAEEQDTGISETGSARRVMAAERQRRDPDGPPPMKAAKKSPKKAPQQQARSNSVHSDTSTPNGAANKPAFPAPEYIRPAVLDQAQAITVREDGALVLLEGARVAFTLSPELALRVAHVVRRLRMAE